MTIKIYEHEEAVFKNYVKCVPISNVPSDANIISFHMAYKIKTEDDGFLQLKARIASHGKKNAMKHMMKSDCAMCSPIGIRLILAIAAIMRWNVTNADVKSAFLQTGRADRNVYVLSSPESNEQQHYWLIHFAAYGLVSANIKFPAQSDDLINNAGLSHLAYVQQLF